MNSNIKYLIAGIWIIVVGAILGLRGSGNIHRLGNLEASDACALIDNETRKDT